jgi:hypothetical protein
MTQMRRVAVTGGEHIAALAISVALWFGSLFLDAILRIRFGTPIIPAQLVLFLLAFAMTVRVRNPSLAVIVALAWLGFGVYAYLINRHALQPHGFGDRLARYELAWSIETALVVLAGGVAAMVWLRRTPDRTPFPPVDEAIH